MQITTTQADGRSVLRIEGDLRIASVVDAKPELLAALAGDGAIEFDLSRLGQCDTAGIQLLLMACGSARAKGRAFATTGHSAAFLAALERIGVPVGCLAFQPDAPESGADDHALR